MIRWLALAAALLLTPAQAADKWHIGVNQLFIWDYLINQGVSCPSPTLCPQGQSISLTDIATTIGNFGNATTQHVGVVREIIPFAVLVPTGVTDSANWSKIDAVLNAYKNQNLHLILTIGPPVPSWASAWTGTGNGQCFMPPAATDWTSLKNNLAVGFGNYLIHLKAQTGMATWMAGHLTVESFNEFDAGYDAATNCAASSDGNAARNADLGNGIGYMLSTYSIPFYQQSMGSIVGGSFGTYIAAYYAAYGPGYPQIHPYVWGDTTPNLITLTNSYLKDANDNSPSWAKGKIILGETGWPQQINGCSGGNSMADTQRDWVYWGFVSDTTLQSYTQIITFWDGRQYASPPVSGCGGTYGIQSASGTYGNAASNLFWYLTH